MDKESFLLKVNITQQLNAGDTVCLENLFSRLKELSQTDEFFASQVEEIVNNIPKEKADDVLHATKKLSRVLFLRVLNRMSEKKELTIDVIQNYKDQFGEDNDILLAELTVLFRDGYEKNKKRIDEIMQVVS